MKFLAFLVFILSVCSLCFAAEFRKFLKDPAYPGKCVYENLVLSHGEQAKLPNQCARILCGKDSLATIQSCGIMVPPIGCKYTDYIDINAPYSECCQKELVCVK